MLSWEESESQALALDERPMLVKCSACNAKLPLEMALEVRFLDVVRYYCSEECATADGEAKGLARPHVETPSTDRPRTKREPQGG